MKKNVSDHSGGIYIFKSTDNEPKPFAHNIDSIKAYQGKIMSMIIVNYNSA